MNKIELNAILYYADFLSLKSISQPVTDNCKYFFIHSVPINSAFILDLEPIYDENNPYFQQAKAEYEIIRDKFGDEGVKSFVDDICSIKDCGSVNAEQMLKCIHQFSSKKDRKYAFSTYYTWKNSQTYTRITINENGESKETPCTRYIYHLERMLDRRRISKSAGSYFLDRKESI